MSLENWIRYPLLAAKYDGMFLRKNDSFGKLGHR